MVTQTPHLSFVCQKPLQKRVLSGVSGLAWSSSVRHGGAAAYLPGTNDNPASTGARLEHLLTVQELSDYLGIPVATLYDWRVDHCGPKTVKLGRAP